MKNISSLISSNSILNYTIISHLTFSYMIFYLLIYPKIQTKYLKVFVSKLGKKVLVGNSIFRIHQCNQTQVDKNRFVY